MENKESIDQLVNKLLELPTLEYKDSKSIDAVLKKLTEPTDKYYNIHNRNRIIDKLLDIRINLSKKR
jgi:hypothetical protein